MRDRSLFWPFVMIATGLVWLMINMGMIPSENLWALTHAWPFLLIALGLGLILRSFWRFGGRLASLLIVIAAVLAIIYAPQLGWTAPQNWSLNLSNIGADFNGAVRGSGVIKTEDREVSHFTGVDIRYPAVVMVQAGQKDAVQIEADDNLLPQLTTKVQNGILVFDNSVSAWQQRVDPSDRILVTITVTDLTSLNFSSATISGVGSATIWVESSLTANISGVGSIHYFGSPTVQQHVSGLGNVNSYGSK
jgi:hypothetical protein